ncbi:MAG: hypothetical protein M3092_05130 [Actinomycetia bacterium]|nr:hypothetical protein [Actinomycetes bacterium]
MATDTITESDKKPPISRKRRIIEAIALIVGSTLVIGTLSSIALLIYTKDANEPTVHVLDIPLGSYDRILEGENVLDIPSTWAFYAGDAIVLDNKDDVTHTIGTWSVPPNTTRRFGLQPAFGGNFTCSLLPSGTVTLDIQPRGYDFSIIALTTFGFGMSVGVILIIGLTMMRAMGHDEDDDWVDVAFNGEARTDVHV